MYLDESRKNGTKLASGGEPLRSLMRLPEPLTRFDATTGELWKAAAIAQSSASRAGMVCAAIVSALR